MIRRIILSLSILTLSVSSFAFASQSTPSQQSTQSQTNSTSPADLPAYRFWTEQSSGRLVEARVIGAASEPGFVTIERRGDHRQFDVALARFTPSDQRRALDQLSSAGVVISPSAMRQYVVTVSSGAPQPRVSASFATYANVVNGSSTPAATNAPAHSVLVRKAGIPARLINQAPQPAAEPIPAVAPDAPLAPEVPLSTDGTIVDSYCPNCGVVDGSCGSCGVVDAGCSSCGSCASCPSCGSYSGCDACGSYSVVSSCSSWTSSCGCSDCGGYSSCSGYSSYSTCGGCGYDAGVVCDGCAASGEVIDGGAVSYGDPVAYNTILPPLYIP